MNYTLEPNSTGEMTIYLYWHIKYHWLSVTLSNHWLKGSKVSDDGEYYLLDAQQVSFAIGNANINDIKLHVLERQLERDLADSYVRQEKLRDEIQKLKCIAHKKADNLSEVIDMHVEPVGPRPPVDDFAGFDDDIPF